MPPYSRPPTKQGRPLPRSLFVVADLLTLPGRSEAEAEQLMDASAASHKAWTE
jgi:hypothetical protein